MAASFLFQEGNPYIRILNQMVMQKYLLSSLGILIGATLSIHTAAQILPGPQNKQRAVFEELSYLNQNFNNPFKSRNGYSLVAATYEQYDASLQFVKSTDSFRYKWNGDRGANFDINGFTGILHSATYSGLIFNPLTDATALRNALYDFDTIEYYPLLINANSYGDLYKRKITSLDAAGTVTGHSETRLINNNNWQENLAKSYTFDPQNRLTELIEKRLIGGTLTNFSKTSYSYNAADKIETIISSLWLGSTWVNDYKYSYAYDANNNLIDYTVENWQNSDWNKLTKVLLEYNSNNKMISRISQMGATGNWVNARKWEYAYLNNNNIVTIESQPWSSGSWADISNSYEFSYNNLNQCVTRTESIMSSPDTSLFRTIFNYNSVNEIESIIWQNGGATREDFNDHERWVFEYSNAGLTAQYSQRNINNVWSFFYSSAAPGDQSFFQHYYYSDTNTTSISGLKRVALNFAVYPNPCATNLSVAINKEAIKYMVITDLSGKEVLKTNYAQKLSKAVIDVSGIAAGNYILTVGNELEYGVKQISIVK